MLNYLFPVLALFAGTVPCRLEVKDVTPPPLEKIELSASPIQKPASSPDEVLSLRRALALALKHNPELAAFSYEIRAREAESLQENLLPNPELEVQIENVAGGNGYGGFNSAETTLQLSQLIELGGKRVKRKRVAAYRQQLTNWDYEAKKLNVLSGTTKAFVAVLAAQEKVALQTELMNLAAQVHKTVAARVEAGKVSPLEETKAEVALASASLQQKQARHELRIVGIALASYWGKSAPTFSRVAGRLPDLKTLPSLESLKSSIQQNPDVARWKTVLNKNQAELDLTRARPIPDLTVKGGIKQLRDVGSETLVIGVSVPLPLFNRHQGTIRQAQFRLLKAQVDTDGFQKKTTASLEMLYQNLRSAEVSVVTIKEQILSGAKRAFEGINEGYREGKFALLDVLDAQRTLFQARSQYLEALTRYHLLKTDMDRLIGQSTPAADEQGEVQ